MPRQGRKQNKSTASLQPAATPQPNARAKSTPSSQVNGTPADSYKTLKRSELQQCCKELGLRATGKNTELMERLQAYHKKPQLKTPGAEGEAAEKTEGCHQPKEIPRTVPRLDLLQEVKSQRVEKKREVVEGWCVVHGMKLHCPSSSWAPLLLQRGLVYVQDGKNLVPFHLCPVNTPVPDGLRDNHICRECVLRNRENPRKASSSQAFSSSRITPKDSKSHPSPLPSCASKKRLTTQFKKSYSPQEDEAYAQWVDGILCQMARGKLGMDQVLHPLQPLVVHSPSPFNNNKSG